MFDAVISGYLYHKSGHECALNWNGNVIPFPRGGNDWARHTAWTRYVTKVPYPNKNTGNLCAALNATNETVGVGIYLEYARNRFFKPIVELRSRNSTLTLFVCYVTTSSVMKTKPCVSFDCSSTEHYHPDNLKKKNDRNTMVGTRPITTRYCRHGCTQSRRISIAPILIVRCPYMEQ